MERNLNYFANKKVAIIGGTSGLGLAIADYLLEKTHCNKVLVTGRNEPRKAFDDSRFSYFELDLCDNNLCWSFLNEYDVIIYSAGYGRIGRFSDFNDAKIEQTLIVNAIRPMSLITFLHKRLLSEQGLKLVFITSISAKLTSPLFAIYGASKACISNYIESVNIELAHLTKGNRITEIAPGYIQGTSFYGKATDISELKSVVSKIFQSFLDNDRFIIPENNVLYQAKIRDYQSDPKRFGHESYKYKLKAIEERLK